MILFVGSTFSHGSTFLGRVGVRWACKAIDFYGGTPSLA